MNYIKIILTVILLVVYLFTNGQSNSEELRMILYTSIISDGPTISKSSWDKRIERSKIYFDNLDYLTSEKKTLYRSITIDSIGGKYHIELFKIPWDNYHNQSRYLLWYKDFRNEAWLRVGGYIENDLHHLFNYLKKQNFKTKDLRSMIQEWEEKDELFQEAQLECIFDGYLKNKTKADCFKSVFYIISNQAAHGYSPLSEKQLNSVFSKVQLHGYFFDY